MRPQIFSKLSKIAPERPETYFANFVTIDIDWASDEVINDTIDIVEKADVEVTWFVTHTTGVLNRLRENPKFELGVHPNFNFLLDGDPRNGVDVETVLRRLLDIVPEATSLRSHSLFSSTKLLQLMPQYGLTHESNVYIPRDIAQNMAPFRIWNGLVRTPHSFEDDLYLLTLANSNDHDIEDVAAHVQNSFVEKTGFKVLDFHPIHIFLNTEDMSRYERTRDVHRIHDQLITHRFSGIGVRTAFEKLLELP